MKDKEKKEADNNIKKQRNDNPLRDIKPKQLPTMIHTYTYQGEDKS